MMQVQRLEGRVVRPLVECGCSCRQARVSHCHHTIRVVYCVNCTPCHGVLHCNVFSYQFQQSAKQSLAHCCVASVVSQLINQLTRNCVNDAMSCTSFQLGYFFIYSADNLHWEFNPYNFVDLTSSVTTVPNHSYNVVLISLPM